MILTALAGNQTVSFALFRRDAEPCHATPAVTLQMAAQPTRTADEYVALLSAILSQKNITPSVKIGIVASVVPQMTETVTKAIHQLFPDRTCLSVGAGLRTGFTIRTDIPAELGADLVALTAGALTLQQPPFLVLDCGAVTTLSAVAAGTNGPEFLGCAILAGPALCADALKQRAAQLPYVSLTRPFSAIGKNTADSLRAGLLMGHAHAVRGLAEQMAEQMGQKTLPLVVTGEGAGPIWPMLKCATVQDAHLAHRGLYHMALLNEKKSGNPPKRV